MIMGNRRVTESYIASVVGISQGRVHSTLTEDLDMRKVSLFSRFYRFYLISLKLVFDVAIV